MSENLLLSEPESQVAVEELNQPLYYRRLIAVTASQDVTFFRDTITSSTSIDTNMEVPGQLPKHNSFDLWGISMAVAFGLPYADFIKFYNSSYFIFRVSKRVKIEGPLIMLPSVVGARGFATTTAVESYSNGEAHPTAYLPLNIGKSPIKLDSQQNFYLQLVIAAGSVFSATFYAWIFLHGVLRRDR